MRGQLSLDFLISLTLFIFLISYILLRVVEIPTTFIDEKKLQNLRGIVYSTSEILINDPGEPENWHELNLEEIKRIGLMDENTNLTNFLSLSKIDRMEQICSTDYEKFKELIGITEKMVLTVITLDNVTIATCSPPTMRIPRLVAKVSRNVVYRDGADIIPAEILIEVW